MSLTTALTTFSIDFRDALTLEDFSLYDYEGFDPKTIMNALDRIKVQSKISDSEFWNDMMRLVYIAICRGSLSADHLNKTSVEGKTSITKLVSKYGVTYRKTKGPLKPKKEDITVPRISSCYPFLGLLLIKGGLIPDERFSADLPRIVQFVDFPAILPKLSTTEHSRLMLAHYTWARSMHKKITPADASLSHEEIKARVDPFIKIKLESTLYGENERKQFWTMAKISSSDTKYVSGSTM